MKDLVAYKCLFFAVDTIFAELTNITRGTGSSTVERSRYVNPRSEKPNITLIIRIILKTPKIWEKKYTASKSKYLGLYLRYERTFSRLPPPYFLFIFCSFFFSFFSPIELFCQGYIHFELLLLGLYSFGEPKQTPKMAKCRAP